MTIEKADFIAWRTHPVTTIFLESVVEEMNLSVADLVIHAGKNSGNDRYNCGKIEGLRWLADWQPQFKEDKEDNVDESTSSGA